MGNYWIWIWASLGFGLVSAALYTLICWRRGRRGLAKRFAGSAVLYALTGLAICRVLWFLFAG